MLHVVHGLSRRVAPFEAASLAGNMSFRIGDREKARANRAEFCQQLAIDSDSLLFPRQVHGSKVVSITCEEHLNDARTVEELNIADGIVTSLQNHPIAILVADCAPVFIHDPFCNCIGLVHAGWRGTVDGILRNTLRTMASDFGSSPNNCRIWIGPCIGQCCFEVGGEVTQVFREKLRHLEINFGDHIDLKAVNKRILMREGVPEAQIELSEICTYCDRTFFSHRRATHAGLTQTGRMMAVMLL